MEKKRLTEEELKKVLGGGVPEMMEYCNELCAQYGLEEGNLEGLLKICTNAEYAKLFDLCFDTNLSADYQ